MPFLFRCCSKIHKFSTPLHERWTCGQATSSPRRCTTLSNYSATKGVCCDAVHKTLMACSGQLGYRLSCWWKPTAHLARHHVLRVIYHMMYMKIEDRPWMARYLTAMHVVGWWSLMWCSLVRHYRNASFMCCYTIHMRQKWWLSLAPRYKYTHLRLYRYVCIVKYLALCSIENVLVGQCSDFHQIM